MTRTRVHVYGGLSQQLSVGNVLFTYVAFAALWVRVSLQDYAELCDVRINTSIEYSCERYTFNSHWSVFVAFIEF